MITESRRRTVVIQISRGSAASLATVPALYQHCTSTVVDSGQPRSRPVCDTMGRLRRDNMPHIHTKT